MVPDGDGLQGRETSRQQVRVNLVQSLAFVDTQVTQGGVGLPTGESILFGSSAIYGSWLASFWVPRTIHPSVCASTGYKVVMMVVVV